MRMYPERPAALALSIVVVAWLATGPAWAALTDAECERVRQLQGEYGSELCRKTLENPASGHQQFATAEEGLQRMRAVLSPNTLTTGHRSWQNTTEPIRILRKFIYGPGIDEPICMIDTSGASEVRYYYHYDGLGSVIALSNIDGDIVEAYSYDVYGAPTIYTDAGIDGIWRTGDDATDDESAIGI